MSNKNIFVAGSGQMGVGVTQELAENGYKVYLYNRTPKNLDIAFENFKKQLEKRVLKNKISKEKYDEIFGNITITSDVEDAKYADIVIESIVENLESKMEMLKEIDKYCKDNTIITSNTSSLSITKLSTAVKNPELFLGLHFFNPVYAMKLIEIIPGLQTGSEVVESMRVFGQTLNKEVVTVKDSAGFAVNRILIPMINEAIIVYEHGVASIEEIDTAMKNGANHPMGPLELADYIGLDTVLAIMEALYQEFGVSKYYPAPLLKKYVEAGLLGVKTKEGFYKY